MDNNAPPFFRGGGGPGFGVEHHHGAAGGLGWIIFALQLLMLAALAVLLVRAFTWRPAWPRRRAAMAAEAPGDPLELLRYRYARGEITREEFLQATDDLDGPPSGEST